jgi:hypothetical protein
MLFKLSDHVNNGSDPDKRRRHVAYLIVDININHVLLYLIIALISRVTSATGSTFARSLKANAETMAKA